MNKHDVAAAVESEIEYQIAKYGPERQHRHDFASWILLIESLTDRMKAAWASNTDDEAAKQELRKVLAVATVAARDHGIPMRDLPAAPEAGK